MKPFRVLIALVGLERSGAGEGLPWAESAGGEWFARGDTAVNIRTWSRFRVLKLGVSQSLSQSFLKGFPLAAGIRTRSDLVCS